MIRPSTRTRLWLALTVFVLALIALALKTNRAFTMTGVPTQSAVGVPSAAKSSARLAAKPNLAPRLSNMLSGGATIFADGFESGNTSAWSSVTSGSVTLAVNGTAALMGSFGLQATFTGGTTPSFVQDNTPASEARYRARFKFDPNSATLASPLTIFAGRQAGNNVFLLDVRQQGGAYEARAQIRDDASAFTLTPWFAISDAPHTLEIEWAAATAPLANNGYLLFFIDGQVRKVVPGIDNDTRRVDDVQLGAVAGVAAGNSGSSFFDVFTSFNFAARPTVSAEKTAVLTGDVNSNGKVDPGDTLTYNAVLINLGATSLTNVMFTDTIDTHTTLVGGSISSSPIAVDDTYTATGNIQISKNAATGVLANDTDPDGDAVMVTQVNGSAANVGASTATTAAGRGSVTGFVTLNADGSFSYEPPPGYEGTDTFTYTISDPSGKTNDATVTITISQMVWFINNNAGGTNLGTFSNPFTSLASFNTANTGGGFNPDDNDEIALRRGTGTYSEADGINLRNGQKLIGEAVQFNTVFTADANSSAAYQTFASGTMTAPTITTTAGNGVDMASGNTLRGFNVGNTPGFFGFNGTAVGSPTINTVSKTGTGGAINVSTSGAFDAAVTFDTLESTSSPSNNINLVSVTGTLGVTSGGAGLSGTPGNQANVNINDGSVILSYPGNVTKGNAGPMVNVTNGHSGTLTFTGTLSATNGTGLQFDNADGTYNFNGTTSLSGGAVINITNGSGGTFSFGTGTSIAASNTTLFSLTGNSTAAVTYSGSITQSSNGTAVLVQNHSTGTVTFQTGTLNITNGNGLQFDNADSTYNFNGTTTLNGGDAGIDIINGSGGTFSFGANTTITSPTGIAFNLVDGTAAVTYSGNITQASNAAMVSISGGHTTGTVTFQTGTLSATNGTGLQFDNADSTYNFNGTTTLNGGDAGIDILNGSGGAFSFSSNTSITNPTGTAFHFDSSTGNVTYSGNITKNGTSAGLIVDITNQSGGTITFQTGTLSSTSSAGTGIQLSNADSTVNFNGTTTLNGGDAGVDIIAGSGGTFSFSANTTITSPTGIAFNVDGTATAVTANVTYSGNMTQANNAALVNVKDHSTGTITFQTNTLSATNGTGLQFNNADGTYNFNGTNTLNGGDAGIDITTGSGGTFSFSSNTSINNPSGIAYNEDTSTATVTYNGTITKNNNANNAVNIMSKTGGSNSFVGAILASTTTANAIDLTNTGGTVTFRGGLDITTSTGVGFNASGAGATINVCDESPCNPAATGALVNKITSAGGAALSVVNTTIGANKLEFQSISANGGANGILLNNTGSSGGLSVKGTGTANSGGTIQNTTSNGIRLITTQNVSLDRMNIHDTTGSGIKGTNNVVNFSFTNGTINNSNDAASDGANTTDESNIAFNDNQGGTEKNLTGTVTITNNTLTNAFFHGVDIFNYDGTISDANISNNTITSTNSTTTSKGNGIRLIAFGSATTVANVTKATIDSNIVSNFPSGAGIMVQGGNANAGGPTTGKVGTAGSLTDIINITNNTVKGFSSANRIGTQAILAVVNGNGQGNYNITNNGTVANPLTNITGTVIAVSSLGNANVSATVNSNVIVSNNSLAANGIGAGTSRTFGTSADTPTLSVVIKSNNISSNDGNGILATARDATGHLNVTIKDNTVAAPLTGVDRPGIRVDAGNSLSADDAVCLDISGNTTAGSPDTGSGFTGPGIGLRKQGTVTTTNDFGVVGMAATSTPGVEQYVGNGVGGKNPGSANGVGDGSVNGVLLISATSGFSNCATAPMALLQSPTNNRVLSAQADSALPINTIDAAEVVNRRLDNISLMASTIESERALPGEPVITQSRTEAETIISELTPVTSALVSEKAESVTALETSDKSLAEAAEPTLNQSASDSQTQNLTAAAATAPSGRRQPSTKPARRSLSAFSQPVSYLKRGDLVATNSDATPKTASAKNSAHRRAVKSALSGETVTRNIGTLPAGDAVNIMFQVTVDDPFTGSSAQVCNQGTFTYDPSQMVVTDDPDTAAANDPTCTTVSLQADLSITKTDGVTSAVPGSSVTYTITVSNAGPNAVNGNTVADTFPASITSASWTCVGAGGGTCTASGSGNINDTMVNLPVGGSVTYTVTANISPAATGTLSNTATVTPASGVNDPDNTNNSATDTDTLTPQANLGITKTDGVNTAVPGSTVTYTITASNAGPSNAPGSTVMDTFPGIITSANWTCVGAGGGMCTASGSGNINDTVNLPAGGSVTYTVTATISASATGTLSNTATVATGAGVTDPTPGNNSATDTDTLTPQANLGITKTDGVATAVPGGSVTYTITASNAGPSNAPGSTVADTFPASLTCTWTCVGAGGGTCTASGSGNINDTVNLPSGGSVTYTASCTISASATGTLSNTATVATGAGVTDPTPGNNSATDTDTLTPQADLAITKTDGVTTATPGGSVTYTITASNAGPSNATGATVADTFPASLTCTWTCVGAGGGTCTASGSGNINDTVNLPSGGSVTYTASCTISAAATGTLSNTATVAAPGGVTDPTPGNNSATDTDTLTPQADLAITKTDGVTTAVPGGSVTYTITASNAGPSNAPGSTVADTFPASLTCTWTCVGAGGGTCTASGSGNINDTVNLPSGGSVTYTASCTISASATGTLSNTATVATGAGVTDPTPGNNSATDTDTLTPQADLSITKTDGVTTATPGGSVTYTITASNAGPSFVTGATVADTFPVAITSCTWTAVYTGTGSSGPASGSGNINASVNLASGGSVTITATCTISPSATGMLSNTATVTAPGGVTEINNANNSATDTDTLTPQADLSITKTDGVVTAVPGGTVTYTITASNAGPSDAPGSKVMDTFPASITNATWTCVGAGGGTCTASGSGNINDTVNLPAGGSVTYTVTATISAAATGMLSNTATVATAAGVTDPTPGNNSATDTDTLTPQADLSITKTDGVTTAIPGNTVTYTITVSNAGPSDAPGSKVMDTFPVASFTSATWTCVGAGGGTCTASGSGNINDTVNLPVGGSVTYTVMATINSAATGTVSNTATVSTAVGVTDPTPGNNSATDTDTLTPQADLQVTKTDSPDPAVPGGTITYTITVKNNGPSDAATVTLSDPLPANTTLNSVMTAPGWTRTDVVPSGGNGTLTFTKASVANQETGVFTVVVNVNMSPGPSATNSATATSAVTFDPNGANNTGTATTSLVSPPTITKAFGAPDIALNGTTSLTFTLKNDNGIQLTGVQFSDMLPGGLVVATPNNLMSSCGAVTAVAGSNSISLMNGTINANSTCTITLNVTGTSVGPKPNTTGVISATESGPGTTSNTATVTVHKITVSIADPAICLGPGGVVGVTAVVTNNATTPQTVNFTAMLPPELIGLPGTCNANVGPPCVATNNMVTWIGMLNPNQAVTITYQAQVANGTPAGTQLCINSQASYNGGMPPATVIACTTVNCPGAGPGAAPPAAAAVSSQKPGSVLIFNYYTSDPTNLNRQNTRINITNTDTSRSVAVHLFFVDGSNCAPADAFVCLTPNQTVSFLASDFDPGTSGYIVAVAVDERGCPIDFNFLIGDEFVKLSSGHQANLGAEAISALAGGLMQCNLAAGTATLNFDGMQYNRLPRVLAVDNFPSRLDGNDTLLILNRIGGDLFSGANPIGSVTGVLYDESEQPYSFSFNSDNCQFKGTLSNNLPRILQRLDAVVPSGRSGWLRFWATDTSGRRAPEVGLFGVMINFNAGAGANSFNQGHNLHKLTFTNATITIPVIAPNCQ